MRQAFDLEVVVLIVGVENVVDVVPHLGFDLTAAVAEGQGEVWLAGLLGLDLFGDYHECRGDDFVFVAATVANIEILHGLREV